MLRRTDNRTEQSMIEIGFQDNHETLAAETITITVRQPWAALIVCGQKQFETATLPPPSSFIGQRIAIRAAWQRPLGQIGKAAEKEAQDALREAALGELRYGAVIGSALLRAAWRSAHGPSQHLKVDIDGEVEGSSLPCPRQIALSRREALLGNFSTGRWLWRLEEPVMARMASGEGDWRSGAIKWFDQRNGFGFIVNDQGGDDIYVNQEALLLADISEPYPGQPIRFRCQRGSKGWKAVELKACETGDARARGECAGPPPSGSVSRQSSPAAR